MMNKYIDLQETFEGEFPQLKTKPMMLDTLDDGNGWGRKLSLMDLQETFEGEMPKFISTINLEQTFEGDFPIKGKPFMLETIFSDD